MMDETIDKQGIMADHLMLATLGMVFIAILAIAAFTGTWFEAFAIGLPALLFPAGLIYMAPGHLASRTSVAIAFMVYAALMIQQTHGMIEAHFSVFVLLSFLLFYRDWRPIIAGALVIAVHHFAFNFLQEANTGIYLFMQGPSLNIVLIHALFVVFETVWLVYMAVKLRAEMNMFGGMPEEVTKVVRRIAGGDLTAKIRVKAGDTTSLIAAMNDMVMKLTSIINEVRNSTESINTASREIAQGNADLSSRTEMQASSLEETASSMEELTSTVKQNAENAKQANRLATNASDIAVKGGAVVEDVVQTMASISASSKKIADIISVIEGIAFQTNILALNAAVEAARAGEQGRGFAVVASEVRSLAQRSAGAAKEITALIDDSAGKVDAGSKLVDQAGATMTEIVQAVKRVTDIMSEIAAASREQSSGIEQVNNAITQMDEVTQQNAALVEEAAASAEAMQAQAEVLAHAVSTFRLVSDKSARREVKQAKEVAVESATQAKPQKVLSMKAHKLVGMPKLAVAGAGFDGDWKEF